MHRQLCNTTVFFSARNRVGRGDGGNLARAKVWKAKARSEFVTKLYCAKGKIHNYLEQFLDWIFDRCARRTWLFGACIWGVGNWVIKMRGFSVATLTHVFDRKSLDEKVS